MAANDAHARPTFLAICGAIDRAQAEYHEAARRFDDAIRTRPESAAAQRAAEAGTDEEYAAAVAADDAAYALLTAARDHALAGAGAERSLATAALADYLEEEGDPRAAGLRRVIAGGIAPDHCGGARYFWSISPAGGPAHHWLAPECFAALRGGEPDGDRLVYPDYPTALLAAATALVELDQQGPP